MPEPGQWSKNGLKFRNAVCCSVDAPCPERAGMACFCASCRRTVHVPYYAIKRHIMAFQGIDATCLAPIGCIPYGAEL